VTEIDGLVSAIRKDGYAKTASITGWLYAAQLDHRFIDGRLVKRPVQQRAPAWRSGPGGDHLARLAGLEEPRALWAALEELTASDDAALTADAPEGRSAGGLRVLVIGAGPIGLALASALKLALGAGIDVLVVENRVAAPHVKLPYSRRWVTAVPRSVLEDTVEPVVDEIFRRVGDGTYIGVPINMLETLLLLSCKRLGVRLVFSAEPAGFQPDLVFDASGNRLRPPPGPTKPADVTIGENVYMDRLRLDIPGLAKFGVDVDAWSMGRYVTVGSVGPLAFPICENHVLKQALVKVVRIPARLYPELIGWVRRNNADNRYYVWPGLLRAELNELLLIVSLHRQEYDTLCARHVFPLTLEEAAESVELPVLRVLAAAATAEERAAVSLEAPYLFTPYRVEARGGVEEWAGAPCVRVGDSVYNGNPKTANGLGPHLAHVRHIQRAVWDVAVRRHHRAIMRSLG
jgi:hypothetical protein